ncbi:hypothetical protein NESM_000782800 [Novymonas esmeraldas]|uniref:Uncharacterized protein n=1 Tax=Novymonas esmeraldas TaxID=1808958 RepID=A0AAW0EWR8_9TRYP
MHAKTTWAALLRAAECATRQGGVSADNAVEDAVARELARHPPTSDEEAAYIRNCAFGLARFASLCDGAFQGYRDCHKRNGAHKPSMYLVAYLLIFQYRTLGAAVVREMLEGSMPTLRLCEYIDFLLSHEAVTHHAVPRWRAVYDDPFIQRHVLAPLATVAAEVTRDVVEWFRGQPTQPTTNGGESPAADATAAAPAAAAVRVAAAAAPTPPPALRPLTGPRLPPHEVREMAFTVPLPPFPRIKAAPALAPAAHRKEPTTAVGFSFHHRYTTSTAKGPADAAGECAASVPERAAPAEARLTPAQLRAMLSASKVVPTTVTALWRETRVRERQRENAEKALKELEVAVHDATEYELWRQAQREEEERRREMEMVQRHLDAMEAEDRLHTQRQRTTQARRRQLQKMRAQYEAELAANQREQEHALRQQEQHVQQLRRQLSRDGAVAVARSAAGKAATASSVKEESEQLRAAAKAAEEQRQTQQVLVIQEIHLLRQRLRERRAAMGTERRQAWADGVADAALGRMSPAELRDALERLRAEAAAEEEARQQHVTEVRDRTVEQRARLERECLREREKQRLVREMQQAQRAAHRAAVEAERVEKEAVRMAQLHEKLEVRRQAKRAAYRAAHETERQRRNEVLLRSQDGASMERKRWSQYEAVLVRRAEAGQQRLLHEAQQSA